MKRWSVVGLAALSALVLASAVAAAGFAFSGNITSGAQYDLHTVDLVAGENVRGVTNCTSGTLDTILTVFFPGNPQGTGSTSYADVYNDDGGTQVCGGFRNSVVNFSAPTTGTYTFRVDGFGSATGTYTLSITTGGSLGFNSNDARINQDAWAPVAVFCTSGGGVSVSQVVSPTLLTPLFSVTADQVSAAPAGTFASAGGVQLDKLSDGSLQVFGPQADGKGYLFVFNGCPATRTTTYTFDPVTGVSRATGTGGG